jgi:hypothetical protein
MAQGIFVQVRQTCVGFIDMNGLLVSYSQHLIFAITYDWTQKASVIVPGKPIQFGSMEH